LTLLLVRGILHMSSSASMLEW